MSIATFPSFPSFISPPQHAKNRRPRTASMPVNNLSERALLRVQRLLETEEQMKREDEAALVMTESQRLTLLKSFQSVQAEFADLDGLRWSSADAQQTIRATPIPMTPLLHMPSSTHISSAIEGLPPTSPDLSSSFSSRPTLDAFGSDTDNLKTIRASVSPLRQIVQHMANGAGVVLDLSPDSMRGREADRK